MCGSEWMRNEHRIWAKMVTSSQPRRAPASAAGQTDSAVPVHDLIVPRLRIYPRPAGSRTTAVWLARAKATIVVVMTDALETTALETDTAAATLAPGVWTLDPLHSSVAFTVRHLGIAKVRGGFTRFETDFVVDASGAATLGATIHLDSFETGNADRDNHIRTADFLDVANRPTLTFRGSGPVRVAESFTVEGEATLGTITRPVTLEVEWGGVQELPGVGERHAGFSATGTIKRTDFGVGAAMPGMLSDAVRIELEIQLIEPK